MNGNLHSFVNLKRYYIQRYYNCKKYKGFENMNLTTYSFQAPEFYKKCGFEIEFIRESKQNPKLTKYFLVKYF